MRTFEIADDLTELVWKLAGAKPFENLDFGAALRRVLSPIAEGRSEHARDELKDSSAEIPNINKRSKAPKADLRKLVDADLLRDREELFLVDYQANRVKQYKAVLMDGGLQFDGRNYSMSLLARDLLQKVGFQSDFVRGPAHWVNANGVSVKDLWQRFLDKTTP